MSTSRNQKR